MFFIFFFFSSSSSFFFFFFLFWVSYTVTFVRASTLATTKIDRVLFLDMSMVSIMVLCRV